MAEKSIPDNVVSLDLFRKIKHPRSYEERKEGNLERLISYLEKEIENKASMLFNVREHVEKLLEDAKKAKKKINNQD
jgi:hypothetical protein